MARPQTAIPPELSPRIEDQAVGDGQRERLRAVIARAVLDGDEVGAEDAPLDDQALVGGSRSLHAGDLELGTRDTTAVLLEQAARDQRGLYAIAQSSERLLLVKVLLRSSKRPRSTLSAS